MNDSNLVFGIIILIIGLGGIFYAESIRRKKKMDFFYNKMYIFSVLAILLGVYLILFEPK